MMKKLKILLSLRYKNKLHNENIKFLKEQGLVNIDKDNEIYTTDKMDTLVISYYPESTMKKEILSFLEGV